MLILGGSAVQLLFLGGQGDHHLFSSSYLYFPHVEYPILPAPLPPRAPAGYHAARLYRTLKGTDWKKASLMTAMLYPSVVFGMGFFLNFFIWGEHSSGAVSHDVITDDVITGDVIINDVITLLMMSLLVISPFPWVGWMCCVGTSDKGHFPLHQPTCTFLSLHNGQNDPSQCVRYLEFPLYTRTYIFITTDHMTDHLTDHMTVTGSIHHDAGSAVYVVWYLISSRLRRILFRVPQAALRAPREDQSDSSTDTRAGLVPSPCPCVSSLPPSATLCPPRPPLTPSDPLVKPSNPYY